MTNINEQTFFNIEDAIYCAKNSIFFALDILCTYQTLIDNNIDHTPKLIPIAKHFLINAYATHLHDVEEDFGKLLENMQEILQHINSGKEL